MSKFDKTGLESFFKSTFYESKSNPSEWNNPGDEVFDAAIQQIKNKKKVRRKLYFFIFAIICLTCFTSSVFYKKHQELNHSEKTTEKLKLELNKNDILKESNNKNSFATLKATNPSSTIANINPTQSLSKNSGLKNTSTLETKYNISKNNHSVTRQNNPSYTKKDVINKFNNRRITTDISTSNSEKEYLTINTPHEFNPALTPKTIISDEISLIHIPFLTNNLISLIDFEESTFNKTPIFVTDIHTTLKSNYISFSLTSGINHSRFSMAQSELLTDMTLSEFSNYKGGFQISSQLNYNLTNRFDIGLQTAYYSFNANSVSTQDSEFNSANIINTDADRIYMMPINVMTPIGSYRSSTPLVLDNNISALRTMNTESKTSQNIHVLQVGLVASYALLKSNRMQGGIRTSIAYNRIISQHSTFDMTISSDDIALGNIALESDGVTGLNYNYASVTSGLFFNYSLTNQLHLNINTNYSTSINSALHSQSSAVPKTYLRYFENNIGLSYRF